jgi:two-component system phosphate regulon sensor histidine kinase PhoR
VRDAAHLRRHRRAIVLFVPMVLLPAVVFGILIVRAVRSDRMQAAQLTGEHQRQIVRLVEADLQNWLFSPVADGARSAALFQFQVVGDLIEFPAVRLSLPVAVSSRGPRPPESMPPNGPPTADVIKEFYYPRILVFLRDLHSGAQYFLRLRTLVVLMPDRASGYALAAQQVLDHVNRRLADLCAGEGFTGALWVGDLRDEHGAPPNAAFGLEGFSFFQVVFHDARSAEPAGFRGHAFAYSMAVLVALTTLGSVLVYRTVTREARISQLRSDFVSAVSHEFRSPLSAILALSERLEGLRITDPEKLVEYHRVIGTEARRLSALVTRLLDFAQIEQGKKTYSHERVDLAAAARDAVEACRYVVHRDRIRLESAAAPRWVIGDPTALRHCIQNLIENAAKYSPSDAPITVTCESQNGTHSIGVQDLGIGVPIEERARIFDKFYRGQQASALDTQGVGIGLALVKHVMESHHGTVSLENGPGKGSLFRLSFPTVTP